MMQQSKAFHRVERKGKDRPTQARDPRVVLSPVHQRIHLKRHLKISTSRYAHENALARRMMSARRPGGDAGPKKVIWGRQESFLFHRVELADAPERSSLKEYSPSFC